MPRTMLIGWGTSALKTLRMTSMVSFNGCSTGYMHLGFIIGGLYLFPGSHKHRWIPKRYIAASIGSSLLASSLTASIMSASVLFGRAAFWKPNCWNCWLDELGIGMVKLRIPREFYRPLTKLNSSVVLSILSWKSALLEIWFFPAVDALDWHHSCYQRHVTSGSVTLKRHFRFLHRGTRWWRLTRETISKTFRFQSCAKTTFRDQHVSCYIDQTAT